MKTIQVILILSIVIFGSCTNRQFYESYSTKIDSLNSSLEASASSYETIDTSIIVTQYQIINQNLDSLKLFPETALDQTVVQYRYVQKKYKTILRGHPLNIKELNYSRQQLSDLKEDFDKRRIEVETGTEYYKVEKEAIINIKKRMNAYQALIKESTKKFETLNPEILILLDSLAKTEQH